MCDRLGQTREDRDAIAAAVQDHAGVSAGMVTVDHAQDVVLLRRADQSVGRLAVLAAELALAVYDGGGADRKRRAGSRSMFFSRQVGMGRFNDIHRIPQLSHRGGDKKRKAVKLSVDEKSSLMAGDVPTWLTLSVR